MSRLLNISVHRLLPICLLVLLGSDRASSETTGFLRRPDIHGDAVVFSSEGDLWLGSIESRTARRITTHEGLETFPHFSPDGKTIAFTGGYDGGTEVYTISVDGGAPQRITYDRNAIVSGWTPDGKSILFLSSKNNMDRGNRLFRVPADGGMPVLLPIPKVEFAGMHADGIRIAYVPLSGVRQNWKGYAGGRADDVWLTDLSGKRFTRLTDFAGIDTMPLWIGSTIYFVSERGGAANLYRIDPNTRKIAPVTRHADFDAIYPGTDGKRIVYQLGPRLALYDPSRDRSQVIDIDLSSDRIHTRTKRVPVSSSIESMAIGPTGKRLLAEARGCLFSIPAEQGDWRILPHMAGSRDRTPAWSPDGKYIAFVSDRSGDYQVWVAPVSGNVTPRQLTQDHVGPISQPVWSPDSKRLAIGDHEMRVMLVDAVTGAITLVDQSDRGGTYHSRAADYTFSPDGKWLAYSRVEPNWNTTVCLYEVASRKITVITDPDMDSSRPVFDAKGKFLWFLSDRNLSPTFTGLTGLYGFEKMTRVSLVPLAAKTPSPFLLKSDEEGEDGDEATGSEKSEPKEAGKDGEKTGGSGEAGKLADDTAGGKPETEGKAKKPEAAGLPKTEIDTDGLRSRIIDLPVPADRYFAVEPLEDRVLLGVRLEPGGAPAQLRSFDMKKREVLTVITGMSGFELSADRKKLLVQSNNNAYIVDAKTGPFTYSSGRVDLSSLAVDVDPVAEWRQIFREAWRIARDFFYDPDMHGVDWEAVKRKYEAMLPSVGDRSDLNIILGEMIGELNVGHAYVGGGDLTRSSSMPMGYLGADFEPTADGAAVRITKLYPGDGFDLSARSPLLDPGVNLKVGDYILEVAGQPVSGSQDMQALLIGTAGRTIRLMVNDKPIREGSRVIRVKPLDSESTARYQDWVMTKRDYVRKNGGEGLQYIHIPDMGNNGLSEFAKHYFPNVHREGMIFDVRNNGGGSTSGVLLLQIASRPVSFSKPRYGASWSRQRWGFAGHAVTLCNEFSGSDAEWFSDMFRRLKLGPVVGKRTWGGLVGSGGGYSLVDGGRLNIPNYGAWYPDGTWVVEGPGFVPDIEVDQDPAAVLAGRDPQLDRAIAYLKEKLAKEPVTTPIPPPFPNKARVRTRTEPAK